MTERAKPISPYTRLLETCRRWAVNATNPRRRTMWTYPKAKLCEAWVLENLYQRVSAAAQLGWNVELKATDDGLQVLYVEQAPAMPWELRE